MKPLRVRMQAFGPYAREQRLDFADLAGNRFFLITGPTGSGKTSVLDAMAYALYGETTSGAEKDGGRAGADMRSQHAPADLLTEVDFEFGVGADTYRVLRRPAQQRPRKRGDGTAQEAQQATMWRLEPDAVPGETREAPLASGWAAVTRQTEDILGFRAEQFRQVVMLPQGRFQELLRSDSRGREEILARLFDTAFYARIELALKENAAGLRREHEKLGDRRGLIFEQIGVAGPDELTEELAATHAAVAEATREGADRASELDAAQRALLEAQSVADKLATARREADALHALVGRSAAVEDQRRQLQAARKAALVGDAARAAQLRDAERASHELRLLEARQALEQAQELSVAAAARWTALEACAPEREQAAEEVRRLRALQPVVDGSIELRRQLAEASAASAAATRTAAEAAAEAIAAMAASDAAQQTLSAAESAAAPVAALERVAAETAAHTTRRGDLQQAAEAFGEAQHAAADAAVAAELARQAYGDAVAQLALVEEAWARGQASVLASRLATGEPCPVCGSTEHPTPAPATDAPSEATVAAARHTRDETLAARDEAAHVASEAAHEADALAQQVEHLVKTLGEWAARTPEECQAATRAAGAELAEARQAADRLPGLRDALTLARQTAQNAAQKRDELAQRATAAAADERSLHAQLDERTAGVPPDCSEPAALEAVIRRAQERRDELDAAADKARRAAQQAEVQCSGAAADVKAAEQALARAAAAADEAETTLAERLAAHGFADEEAWLDACCPGEELEALDEAVTRFDADIAAARARHEQAVEAASRLAEPDLEAVRTAAAAARDASEQAARVKADLDSRLAALRAAAEQLRHIQVSSQELQLEYEVVGRVADVCTGSNPLRLNFQRFVLGAFLDRVLEVASQRLRLMSSDRYELQRTETSRGHGRAAGLELVVFDAWTGYARPVATLSGGETFLAALALALGLADVVQSHSGGIRLDTIFVDEGFGSLDDEALDLAVAALIALQDGGRLVGIISHVAELRERIDARLEITAGKTGSSARFVVP